MTEKVVFFDEISVEQTLSPFVCTLTEEDIKGYLEAVEDRNPLYGDEEFAKKSAFGGLITPPGIVAIYFVRAFHAEMKPPPGGIQAGHDFEFYQPARPGDILTTTTRVVDKYIKKERKYVEWETVTTNHRGELIVKTRARAIWPA